AQIKAHQHGISALVELDGIIVTGSSDSTLKIWSLVHNLAENPGEATPLNDQQNITLTQTITTGKSFPLSTSLSVLPGLSSYVLAVGATEKRIRIYIRGESQFVEATSLPGHEDWVKSLDFCALPDNSLLLASGSQDGTIRLWSVTRAESHEQPRAIDIGDQLLDDFEQSLIDIDDEYGGKQISMRHHLIQVRDNERPQKFHMTFDSLLIGHDAGVTGVAWNPNPTPPLLLSTATDASVILWSLSTVGSSGSEKNQLWINQYRFGDVGGQRFGGFVGGFWITPSHLCAWGWNGGLRQWHSKNGEWKEKRSITGHAAPVHGIDWEPQGRYLISASLDQTVRIHGQVFTTDRSNWFEIARAQTHGYDCLQAVFLSDLRFASISDEKVTRIFDAPGSFMQLTAGLGIRKEDDITDRPLVASVPPLGLSNKAASTEGTRLSVMPLVDFNKPPSEAELAATTLWPEIEKIFGHGYESIALAVSRSRKLIASACKATSPQHAVVRLYDTENFRPYGVPLEGHTLTITRISFNHDDSLILAVGKDRTWHLFKRSDNNGGYHPFAAAKNHARIIWDSHVKIWNATGPQPHKEKPVATIKLEQAATSVAFKHMATDGQVWLAVGLETGDIMIFSSSTPFDQWKLELKLPSNVAHVGHVRQLSWRSGDSERAYLASSSDDGSVRVIEICH
ncbi:WD40 repeat-like protein, partial [Serendipita vermifera]